MSFQMAFSGEIKRTHDSIKIVNVLTLKKHIVHSICNFDPRSKIDDACDSLRINSW